MDVHDQRLRQAWVRDRQRALRLGRLLPLDGFFLNGHLNPWQWRAGYEFREGRLLLVDARARGQIRWSAVELKPRKASFGFSMTRVNIERTLQLEKWLPVDWLDWALVLVGEKEGTVEVPQAQRVCTALGEYYGLRPERALRQHG